jgi:hypothetical protein
MAATSYFGELPPELAVEAQKIARQEAMANAILERSQQPLAGRQAGHLYVAPHPMEGVAQLGAAYFGNQAHQRNEAAMGELANRYNNMLGEGVQDYMRQRYGTGVQPDPQEVQQSQDFGTPPPAPAQGNQRQAIITAMTSRNPFVRQLGSADYGEMKQNEKPIVVPSDSTLTETGPDGQRRPTVVGAPKNAIPEDWSKHLPPGSKIVPTDPRGVFRMSTADGREGIFAMEFEGGQPKGYKRLDNELDPNRMGTGRGVPVELQDPNDPMGVIVVDSITKQVIGKKPKVSQRGAFNADASATFQNVNSNLDKLEKQVQLAEGANLKRVTGLQGALPNVPGFAGADAQSRLDSLKSMIKLDVLQALRNAAHNGSSGLGQVTEKEHEILGQYLGSLEKAQSESEIRRVLGDIKKWVAESRGRYRTAYEQKLGNSAPPSGGKAGNTPPPPAGFQPL